MIAADQCEGLSARAMLTDKRGAPPPRPSQISSSFLRGYSRKSFPIQRGRQRDRCKPHGIHFNALDFLAGRAPGQSDPNLTKLFGFDTFRQSLL